MLKLTPAGNRRRFLEENHYVASTRESEETYARGTSNGKAGTDFFAEPGTAEIAVPAVGPNVSGARRLLVKRSERSQRREGSSPAEEPEAAGVPANIRVNDPAEDASQANVTTHSEPSLAVSGQNIVISFNDSNPVASFSGYATSGDGGRTFTDRGAIAGDENGDGVLAVDRNGTFYMAWGDNRDLLTGRNEANVYFASTSPR